MDAPQPAKSKTVIGKAVNLEGDTGNTASDSDEAGILTGTGTVDDGDILRTASIQVPNSLGSKTSFFVRGDKGPKDPQSNIFILSTPANVFNVKVLERTDSIVKAETLKISQLGKKGTIFKLQLEQLEASKPSTGGKGVANLQNGKKRRVPVSASVSSAKPRPGGRVRRSAW